MKIKCQHGFFTFEETSVGQVSDFQSRYEIAIAPFRDRYTFEDLIDAPTHSIKNALYMGQTALKTFAGEPWDVFKANGLVYNFNTGLIVPISSVTETVDITLAGNRFFSSGLILPGSVTADGSRVTDYSAWFSRATYRWLYSEVSYA